MFVLHKNRAKMGGARLSIIIKMMLHTSVISSNIVRNVIYPYYIYIHIDTHICDKVSKNGNFIRVMVTVSIDRELLNVANVAGEGLMSDTSASHHGSPRSLTHTCCGHLSGRRIWNVLFSIWGSVQRQSLTMILGGMKSSPSHANLSISFSSSQPK